MCESSVLSRRTSSSKGNRNGDTACGEHPWIEKAATQLTTITSTSIVVQLEAHPVMDLIVSERDVVLDESKRVRGSESGRGARVRARASELWQKNQPTNNRASKHTLKT